MAKVNQVTYDKSHRFEHKQHLSLSMKWAPEFNDVYHKHMVNFLQALVGTLHLLHSKYSLTTPSEGDKDKSEKQADEVQPLVEKSTAKTNTSLSTE